MDERLRFVARHIAGEPSASERKRIATKASKAAAKARTAKAKAKENQGRERKRTASCPSGSVPFPLGASGPALRVHIARSRVSENLLKRAGGSGRLAGGCLDRTGGSARRGPPRSQVPRIARP